MANKLVFDDFIATVASKDIDFVSEIHKELINRGCKIEIKSAKNGYVVSYILSKKSVFNYVFRKTGLLVRIYANSLINYMELLDTLPVTMKTTIKNATECKRLTDPNACNPRCSMGYDFILNGERLQKCRNSAFMFLVTSEHNKFIKEFLLNETK